MFFVFKRILKKKDGAALVVVLLVLMVFSISYGGTIYVSNKNIESTIKSQEYTQDYYSAEIGINVMVELIKQEAQQLLDTQTNIDNFKALLINNVTISGLTDSLVNNLSDGNYEVIASDTFQPLVNIKNVTPIKHEDNIRFEITSKEQSRTLSTAIEFSVVGGDGESDSFFYSKYAIIGSGQMNITGLTVTGAPIASTNNNNKSIVSGSYGSVPGIHLREKDSIYLNEYKSNYNCEWLDSRVQFPDYFGDYNPCAALNASQQDKKDLENFSASMVMPEMPVNTGVKLVARTVVNDTGHSFELINSNGNISTDSFWGPSALPSSYGGKLVIDFPTSSDTFYIPKINLAANKQFPVVFNLGNGTDRNVKIITDSLNFSGHYYVIGNGSVTFYVTDTNTNNIILNANNSTEYVGNPEDVTKTIIYVYGKRGTNMKEITIGGGASYHLSIMGEYLNANITSGGGYFGNFVTGGNSIKLSGGSTTGSTLFYIANPSGKFEMSGGAKFKGALITNDFTSSGGVSIEYDAKVFETLPFELTTPNVGEHVNTEPGIESVTLTQDPTVEK